MLSCITIEQWSFSAKIRLRKIYILIWIYIFIIMALVEMMSVTFHLGFCNWNEKLIHSIAHGSAPKQPIQIINYFALNSLSSTWIDSHMDEEEYEGIRFRQIVFERAEVETLLLLIFIFIFLVLYQNKLLSNKRLRWKFMVISTDIHEGIVLLSGRVQTCVLAWFDSGVEFSSEIHTVDLF